MHLDVFLPWNLLLLQLCFELFESWLVCHCCFVPKPDMHNVDVYQKETSILFLGYQKASNVSILLEYHLLYLIFVLKGYCDQSKCSSNKTPRYLLQVFCLIFRPFKWKLTFQAILFAQSHWARFDRSKFCFMLMSLRNTGI